MHIIVISGLSGAGKSIALHMLEDLGYYCIDNMPAALLKPFVSHTVRSAEASYQRTAIGLDARNTPQEVATVPALLDELKRSGIHCEVVYLQATDDELLRRYAETRRKHPLSIEQRALPEAIQLERELLAPIAHAADRIIDTSRMGLHDLRHLVHRTVGHEADGALMITFVSFGFKRGIPGDADFVFDVRTLPNPYWEPALRHLSGRDPAVIEFLKRHAAVQGLIDDIESFVTRRIADYRATSRGYLTIAVGCTGGRHRSVYVVEQLLTRFTSRFPQAIARHNGLGEP
ncbi:MAG TPA: RNase adapter RapZ [Steroidobacteraceae bacterium]|nr:RNase adapter RapZ [Steroidobacteraceae bacterium]